MNPGSFEEFYMREYQPVLAYARVLTGDRPTAEDLTHEAFAAALETWQRIENPQGWVRRVVANKAKSGWRRRDAEQRALTRLRGSTRFVTDLPDDTEDFWRLVRSLPHHQAQAVALFYLEDLPVSEIAMILGCQESTARGHLSKGRRSLAKKLGVAE